MNAGSTSYYTSLYNKLYEKDNIIEKQYDEIDLLKTELMNKSQENHDLKSFRKQCFMLEEKMKEIEKEVQKLNKEKLNIIKKRNETNSLFKRKIGELENLIEFEKLDHKKNTVLFNQKMSVFNHIVMENEVYSKEVKKLKSDLKNLEEKKKEEFQKLKVENLIKFDKVKKKMFNTIKETNEAADKLNKEYLDTSDRLYILQNKQLLLHLDFQKEKIKDLTRINEELMYKINKLEKDIETHKLIEKDLLHKSKAQNGEIDTSFEKSKKGYKTFYFKKKKNLTNNIWQKKERKNHSESNDKNNIKYISSTPKIIKSSSSINFISKPSVLEKRLLNYQKQIKQKKFENENILLINSKLKNRLYLYYNKFNGLFFFLEECIQNFFRDQTLLENKHFLVKMDDIKKFKFDELTKEQQYSILVLLMKHLMPLITLNFNNKDNIGKEIFKTNLNIIDKNFTANQNYLNDKILKNAFIDNNKYYKNLHMNAKTSFSNASIPVLRKLQDIELNFFEFKNKAIFS